MRLITSAVFSRRHVSCLKNCTLYGIRTTRVVGGEPKRWIGTRRSRWPKKSWQITESFLWYRTTGTRVSASLEEIDGKPRSPEEPAFAVRRHTSAYGSCFAAFMGFAGANCTRQNARASSVEKGCPCVEEYGCGNRT